MKTVPYSKVRESFTEIAQNVQFYKEPCVFEKNNKPSVVLMPIEYLKLIEELFKNKGKSKDIDNLVKKYSNSIFVDSKIFMDVKESLKTSNDPSKQMQAAIRAAKRSFKQEK